MRRSATLSSSQRPAITAVRQPETLLGSLTSATSHRHLPAASTSPPSGPARAAPVEAAAMDRARSPRRGGLRRLPVRADRRSSRVHPRADAVGTWRLRPIQRTNPAERPHHRETVELRRPEPRSRAPDDRRRLLVSRPSSMVVRRLHPALRGRTLELRLAAIALPLRPGGLPPFSTGWQERATHRHETER